MLFFSFSGCISLSTNETSDESHYFIKICLCTSEPPYLISIAFHITDVYCWPFSNHAYAVSCLPVEPFSWASSENVYKTIIRMSVGWVCVVLYHIGHSVSCMNILFESCKSPDQTSGESPHIKWAVSLVIWYGQFNLSLNTTVFL